MVRDENDSNRETRREQTFQTSLNVGGELDVPAAMVEEVQRGNKRIARFAGLTFPHLLSAKHYLRQFGWSIVSYPLETNFVGNSDELIHRWLSYVQGFSASFVRKMFGMLGVSRKNRILDPFMGSGTVPVEALLTGYSTIGLEINPYMFFVSKIKIEAILSIDPGELLDEIRKLDSRLSDNGNELQEQSIFLKQTKRHFDPDSLQYLLNLKRHIWSMDSDASIGNLTKLAFLSILVDASRMKRAPCMGYPRKEKPVGKERTARLFRNRTEMIIDDLFRLKHMGLSPKKSDVSLTLADARTCDYDGLIADAVVTSPPYVNGMDYVNNYKLELVWGNFAESYSDLRALKNEMVACDNISRTRVKSTVLSYDDESLEDILDRIEKSLDERPTAYRRNDQPKIVAQYFNDLFDILENTTNHLRSGGHIALVVGDSLIADVYIPADLLLARICTEHLGYKLVKILKTRDRRSGQRTTFKLRETVTILQKT